MPARYTLRADQLLTNHVARKSVFEHERYLDELDLDALLNLRNTWEDGPRAKQKRQSRVIGFFWACVRRRYLTENPAVGLGKIKVVQVPTDYFPPDEFERIVAATYIHPHSMEDALRQINANHPNLHHMILLEPLTTHPQCLVLAPDASRPAPQKSSRRR